MTIDEILAEDGEPEGPPPPTPPWHVDSDSCTLGWISCGVLPEHMNCDCENPEHPWPARVAGDGPRDCRCYACEGHEPRWERGKLASCEYKDHHCDTCHEEKRCTVPSCGF